MMIGNVPKTAMAIFAHPDDIEVSCGGLIAKWTRYGTKIIYVLVTSGEAGIKNPRISKFVASSIREREQLEAAKFLDIDEVVFLREPDCQVQAGLPLRKLLVREIRKYKPEVVLTHDPTVIFSDRINHPDHIAVGNCALAATFPSAEMHHVFPELLERGLHPHKVGHVYIPTTCGEGNYTVNITEEIKTVIGALVLHKSQIGVWDAEDIIERKASCTEQHTDEKYIETYRVIELN